MTAAPRGVARATARERLLAHCAELAGPNDYTGYAKWGRAKARRLLAAVLREAAEAGRAAADIGFTEGRGKPGQTAGGGLHGMSVQHRTAVLQSVYESIRRAGRSRMGGAR